jgi:hypothetical protein
VDADATTRIADDRVADHRRCVRESIFGRSRAPARLHGLLAKNEMVLDSRAPKMPILGDVSQGRGRRRLFLAGIFGSFRSHFEIRLRPVFFELRCYFVFVLTAFRPVPNPFPHSTLPTWDFPMFEFAEPEETQPARARSRRSRSRSRSRKGTKLGAMAIAVGLVLGGLAFAYWRSTQRPEAASAVPAPALVSTPAPEPLWMPSTRSEINQLLETARTWLTLSPQADDHDVARMVWISHWRGIPFPRDSQVADRHALADVVELVDRVVVAARAEQSKPAVANPPTPPHTEEPDAADSVVPIRDTPTPGSFYRIRPGDELLGAEGIVAKALCEAAIDAGRRKGWSLAKAEGRASKLASKPEARATYADLIHRSAWNTGSADTLTEGALLWLPPVWRARLVDRTRGRQIVLDPRPWPDGSSRQEPPPQLRQLAPGSQWITQRGCGPLAAICSIDGKHHASSSPVLALGGVQSSALPM